MAAKEPPPITNLVKPPGARARMMRRAQERGIRLRAHGDEARNSHDAIARGRAHRTAPPARQPAPISAEPARQPAWAAELDERLTTIEWDPYYKEG